MKQAIDILRELIAIPSLTPYDEGCQNILSQHLQEMGFKVEALPADPVDNFWAQRGSEGPLLAFAGHTDVVPPGPKEQWHTPPFTLTEQDKQLFGRGTADMKGGIAAMVAACSQFISDHPQHRGTIGFIITSGEEGNHFELGTPVIMRYLKDNHITVDWCIVGEPSSQKSVGDMVKIGRRGSLTATLTVLGKQGHVAYPHLATNPIHTFSAALAELSAQAWDAGSEHFPPTTMQFSQINAGTGESNVIPGELIAIFNFRFSTESTPESLQRQVVDILQKHGLDYQLNWRLNGEPFLTSAGRLVTASVSAIQDTAGIEPILSTTGGTSDGRFIAPYGIEVLELGLCSASIHQVNEHIGAEDLQQLTRIYYAIMARLLV